MKKKYLNTPEIDDAYRKWVVLQKYISNVFNDSFFKRKVSISEKLEYLNALTRADNDYWRAVYLVYPELRGKELMGDSIEIKIKD